MLSEKFLKSLITPVPLLAVISGCTVLQGGNTPTVAPGTYKITTEGRNVKITGNGVVKTDTFKLPENWYTRKLTYYGSTQRGRMDYFEADLRNVAGESATGFSETRRGTFVMNDGLHYPECMSPGTTDTFYLQTNEPTVGVWIVEYIAPPEESNAGTAPRTFTGTGTDTAGVVRLPTARGKATITYNGPAEGFRVDFLQQDSNYPQYPGFFNGISDATVDNLIDGHYVPSHTWTVDIDNYTPGLMVLADVNAPAGGSWSITISPAL